METLPPALQAHELLPPCRKHRYGQKEQDGDKMIIPEHQVHAGHIPSSGHTGPRTVAVVIGIYFSFRKTASERGRPVAPGQ